MKKLLVTLFMCFVFSSSVNAFDLDKAMNYAIDAAGDKVSNAITLNTKQKKMENKVFQEAKTFDFKMNLFQSLLKQDYEMYLDDKNNETVYSGVQLKTGDNGKNYEYYVKIEKRIKEILSWEEGKYPTLKEYKKGYIKIADEDYDYLKDDIVSMIIMLNTGFGLFTE